MVEERKEAIPTYLLIALLAFIYLVNIAQGWGMILFVPEIYSLHNSQLGQNGDGCAGVFGDQFISMTLISGVGPVFAKLTAFIVQLRFSLPLSMLFSSLVSTIAFLLLAVLPDTALSDNLLMAVAKAAFAYLNLSLWLYMMGCFEGRLKTTATVIIDGCSKFGALFGSAFVAFLPVITVKVIMGSLGVVQTAILCAMSARIGLNSRNTQ